MSANLIFKTAQAVSTAQNHGLLQGLTDKRGSKRVTEKTTQKTQLPKAFQGVQLNRITAPEASALEKSICSQYYS